MAPCGRSGDHGSNMFAGPEREPAQHRRQAERTLERNLMRTLFIASMCAVGLWLGTTSAEAHHSMAGFDRKQTVTLTGTIQAFRWENPHSSIDIDVAGKDGKVVTWKVEMTAPGYLVRTGWKRTTIKQGDT